MCLRSLVCDVVEPGVELNAAPRDIAASSKYSHDSHCKQKHKQWIGLREHLQETTLLRCFPAGMMDCGCKLARFQDSMNQKKPAVTEHAMVVAGR